ncbi:unnamed protein product, partial [Nesidiocoris tenuis]
MFSQDPKSYDEFIHCQARERENVLKTFGYEPTRSEISDSTMDTLDDSGSIDHCTMMARQLKQKIDTVLELMHKNPQSMKGFIMA